MYQTAPHALVAQPTGAYRRRSDWLVWGLNGIAMTCSGFVLGGGYRHLTLVIAAALVFIGGAIVVTALSYKKLTVAAWLNVSLVGAGVGLAIFDVAITDVLLPTPIWALYVVAVLAFAQVLLLLRRLSISPHVL